MSRQKSKWKCAGLIYLICLSVFTKSLPVQKTLPSLVTKDTLFVDGNYVVTEKSTEQEEVKLEVAREDLSKEDNATKSIETDVRSMFRSIRPGQEVIRYAIQLTIEDSTFRGRAVLDVRLTLEREDPIVLHCRDLNIQRVTAGVFTDTFTEDADFGFNDDDLLEITPRQIASNYILIIEYTGQLGNSGRGLYRVDYGDTSYIGMNLHPTNARRVFPCMDQLDMQSTVTFTFVNLNYNSVIMNSMPDDTTPLTFRALPGPLQLWGMVAHSFSSWGTPVNNVGLFGRPAVTSQNAFASVAINSYFNNLIEWTNKPYFELLNDQSENMQIIAMPDTNKDWYALSTVCIWEPYILMENLHSVKQRKTALLTIAEGLSRQWFGYAVYPQNWRFEYITSGLAEYTAYEVFKRFQTDVQGLDTTLLDVNTLFVTDVIQESLLRDASASSRPLEPSDDVLEEEFVRDQIYSFSNLKMAALLRMLRLCMGDANVDPIQGAARNLLSGRALDMIGSGDFYDALLNYANDFIPEVDEYMEPWVQGTGYPVLNVVWRPGGVFVTVEHFGFSSRNEEEFIIPLSYTTSVIPNFSDNNVYPYRMLSTGSISVDAFLDEEDWILFNIQGQGYYRVGYDTELWERLLETLFDRERREVIHPLNRATLIDDALNLARGGKLFYRIALEAVLSLEHETEYAVWKAFVRNMRFLQRRLEAMYVDDDELDPDIYLRMVRRTVGRVESDIGFYPDVQVLEPPMISLTRGLVMDHACRAGYQPCIAAALDWFYDPNNFGNVNPNIPHDMRPAVYCSAMKYGDDNVRDALLQRIADEASLYERLVILESLGCSQDENYIRVLLEETISANSAYGVEERSKIFAAIVESSYQNTRLALNFIIQRTNEVRNTYGGPEKLEELLFVLAENMADADLSNDFNIWIDSSSNQLGESIEIGYRATEMINENRQWDAQYLWEVYEWIDENDATTSTLSILLLAVTLCFNLLY